MTIGKLLYFVVTLCKPYVRYLGYNFIKGPLRTLKPDASCYHWDKNEYESVL
jgi:hypothetical protein